MVHCGQSQTARRNRASPVGAGEEGDRRGAERPVGHPRDPGQRDEQGKTALSQPSSALVEHKMTQGDLKEKHQANLKRIWFNWPADS